MIQSFERQKIQTLEELGVYIWPQVTDDRIVDLAAHQSAELLSDTFYRHYNPLVEKSSYIHAYTEHPLGHNMIHINWETSENDDQLLADEIHNVTGIKCDGIFMAARMLMKFSGFMQSNSGRELSILQTTSNQSAELHIDNEDLPDFEPDSNLVRYILHLRGRRRIEFGYDINDRSRRIALELDLGDAYELKPKIIPHGAEYDDHSLAIYLQT